MVERYPPAPRQVRVATTLLVVACGLGLVLTCFALWANASVSAGLGPLVNSLNRHDRALLAGSWVLHPHRSTPLAANLSALIWLGLSYLVLLPLGYYVRRGFAPARTVTYVVATVLIGLTVVAVVIDDDFTDPGIDQLSPAAAQAWLALFPPGYAGLHYFLLVALIGTVFVAGLLLDRPAAHAFFRGRAAPRRRIIRAAHPRLRTGDDPS